MSAKAQKPQEYFVYFKVFGTQAGTKFAAKRARGFIQRFPKWQKTAGYLKALPEREGFQGAMHEQQCCV
ncbi:MAG: hypothetical protein IJU29_03300 [Oscillospiraceae bacterium]|nr:hypothetical protein [Oscillospiraceae bacterium]